MEKIVVVGVGFPDVIRIIEAINRKNKIIDFLGFLDDKEEFQGTTHYGYPVIGKLDWLKEKNDTNYIQTFFKCLCIKGFRALFY